MENRKGSGIFLGVIGVATLIVAIIGATFAFFSATANSADNAIAAQSTTLSLGYKESNVNLKTHLIPATTAIAKYAALSQSGTGSAANQQCVDDNANEVCSYYEFTIGNPSFTTAQNVYATLTVKTNNFENLWMRIVDDSSTPVDVVKPFNLSNPGETTTGDDYAKTCDTTTSGCTVQYTLNNGVGTIRLLDLDQQLLPSSSDTANASFVESDPSTYTKVTANNKANKKTYKLILWINETNENQENDTSSSFAAGLTFSTGDGTGVTGVIAAAQ